MKVVIVGQAPRALDHPDDHEVWVINGPDLPPRWERLYQLHGIDHIRRKHGRKFVRTLETIGAPQRLIMTGRPDDPPNAEPVDRDWFARLVPRAYFTSSFAYLIALAVDEDATRIVLDGVMWAGGSAQWGAGEGWAVPCVEYHIGRAEAVGVEVVTPPGCGLFNYGEFLYGLEGPGSV